MEGTLKVRIYSVRPSLVWILTVGIFLRILPRQRKNSFSFSLTYPASLWLWGITPQGTEPECHTSFLAFAHPISTSHQVLPVLLSYHLWNPSPLFTFSALFFGIKFSISLVWTVCYPSPWLPSLQSNLDKAPRVTSYDMSVAMLFYLKVCSKGFILATWNPRTWRWLANSIMAWLPLAFQIYFFAHMFHFYSLATLNNRLIY